jgi:hypothetical protein
MRFFPFIFSFAVLLIACGKRGDIYPPPPPPPEGASLSKKQLLAVGKIGYVIGDDNLAVLYWEFPFEYDYAEVYLNGKKIATVKGFSYIYPHPLEKDKQYLFKVLVYKNGKPKGVADIKISF